MSETDQDLEYDRVNWKNDITEIDEDNLNKMDAGIARLFEELKNIKKNYQEVLDDIYDAIVSRGLVFPKENVKDYVAQIYKLKKVDLDIQLQAALAMTEITERVLPVERLKDSVQSSLQVPEKYGLSDALDELCVSAGGNVEIIESLQVSLQTE